MGGCKAIVGFGSRGRGGVPANKTMGHYNFFELVVNFISLFVFNYIFKFIVLGFGATVTYRYIVYSISLPYNN